MQKYQRLAKNALNRLSERNESKIVAILGARQVGKTTLLLDFASTWNGKIVKYLGDKLEDAILWRGKFGDVKNDLELKIGISLEKIVNPILLIFDEVQKIPESFNNLKILHDSYKGKIKIAISGSSSLSLLHKTSESLGGRVEIITMYPLSFSEIFNSSPKTLWLKHSSMDFNSMKSKILEAAKNLGEYESCLKKSISFGFFPEAFLQDNIEEAKLLHQNYHQTYIEKDVRDLKEIGNILDFDLVWKIAHQINSQILSITNISNETGLSFNTVKKYISVLIASYNIIRLLPFTKRIKRRLIKSPKIYSVDIGFFNHCLNIYGQQEMIAASLIGKIFESIMVSEFFKQEMSFLISCDPYFYRSSAGAEVDLLVQSGTEIFAYEFKYSNKVTEGDFSGIKSLISAGADKLKAGFVVSRQPYPEEFGENLFAVPWWFFTV